MPQQPGDLVLNGKYCIERLLGKGASSEVYLAEQVDLRRKRALKILERQVAGVGSTEPLDQRARFRVEAELQAPPLEYPQIVRIVNPHNSGDTFLSP